MDISYNSGHLSVGANGHLLFSTAKDKPFMYAGRGEANFSFHLGNYSISDRVSERIALTDVDIKQTNSGYELTFSRKGLMSITYAAIFTDDRMVLSLVQSDPEINRVWFRLDADEREAVYGCGEQFSYFNLRGKKFPLFTTEQGVGRNKKTEATFLADQLENAGGDYYTTFYPQPTFVSAHKYFLHVDDSSYMIFDFSAPLYHELEIWGVPNSLTLINAKSWSALIAKLTDLLGRQPELPDWVYNGVWLGIQGGTDIVRKKLSNAKRLGLKVSAVWAQDWEGIRFTYFGKRLMWNWEWNKVLYPYLDAEIPLLKQQGIRFLGYINPYLCTDGNLFIEASSSNFLVKRQDNTDYLTDMGDFEAGHLDFTNPEAVAWYKTIIRKNLIDFGLSGWMADFGEYLPTDAKLFSGECAEKMHNVWPVLWAKVNREAIEEAGKLGEIVFFMRAGYTGTQRYTTMMWAGDQNVDWSEDDGLPSVITSALSLGMSGMGLVHSDIGGYTTLFHMKRSKELFMRWAELSAFSPTMRTHEGNRPNDNWQFDSDDETLLHFARMSKVYVALSPYIRDTVRINSTTGMPVMRPLLLHYECKPSSTIKDAFLLGRDLLIAPIITEEATSRSVYLPDDNWIHLWSGVSYSVGTHEIDAPLGYPPVFWRKGSEFSGIFENLKLL